MTRRPAGRLGSFSGKFVPASSLPSALPPRRPFWLAGRCLPRARSEFPGLPPGGRVAPLSRLPSGARGALRLPRGRTPSRPGPARRPPARSLQSPHPYRRPRHLTPPPSPRSSAPSAARPGLPPSSRSNSSLASPSPPGRKETFPGAHSSALPSPHPAALALPSPAPPLFSILGEGGRRLGLKAIDLYVFVPAPEAAPAARAGAAAAAAGGVASLLP